MGQRFLNAEIFLTKKHQIFSATAVAISLSVSPTNPICAFLVIYRSSISIEIIYIIILNTVKEDNQKLAKHY